MPVITLDIGKLPKEQKVAIVKEFTDTASRVTGIPKDAFYVFLNEYDDDNVGIGGQLMSVQEQ